MISYHGDQKFLKDIPTDHTIVIDINNQGIMALDYIHKGFEKQFPETMGLIAPMIRDGVLKAGSVIKNQENGYRVLCVVSRHARVGRMKDEDDVVLRNTIGALEHVKRIVGNDPIASSILIRDVDKGWATLQGVIKALPFDWHVYY